MKNLISTKLIRDMAYCDGNPLTDATSIGRPAISAFLTVSSSSDWFGFWKLMTSTPTLSYSHQVPPCHQPPLATTKVTFLMGSNLSKFLFGTKVEQRFRDTKCPAPPRPNLPMANEIFPDFSSVEAPDPNREGWNQCDHCSVWKHCIPTVFNHPWCLSCFYSIFSC